MSLEVSIQYITRKPWVPPRNLIALWAYATLGERGSRYCDLNVRVVGSAESRRLNRLYRHKDKPTNVLSFAVGPLPGLSGRSAGASRAAVASSRLAGRRAAASRAAEGAGIPGERPRHELGDLVVCAPVVAREAREQGKARTAHWAHMVVHGILHLLGHDHRRAAQARRMELRERAILKSLGYPDPYLAAAAHP